VPRKYTRKQWWPDDPDLDPGMLPYKGPAISENSFKKPESVLELANLAIYYNTSPDGYIDLYTTAHKSKKKRIDCKRQKENFKYDTLEEMGAILFTGHCDQCQSVNTVISYTYLRGDSSRVDCKNCENKVSLQKWVPIGRREYKDIL